MSYYPIIIDLNGKRCLIVGGGKVALRKAQTLIECGAEVTVIAPAVHPRLRTMNNVCIKERSFEPGDTGGFTLVFAASDDPVVNAAVSKEARANGILVNAADDPDNCSFLAPAVMRRGDLLIAVSTSGKSPALSKKIRQKLEQLYGPEYGQLVDLLGSLRDVVKSMYATSADREAAFSRLLEDGILELLRQGKLDEARERAISLL